MARTKSYKQNNTKHVEQQYARDYLENPIFLFFGLFFFILFLIISETLTNIRIYLENNICVQN